MITFWLKQGSKNLQNCNERLIETISVEQDRADRSVHNIRKCSLHYFKRVTKNGEIINSYYLCFSLTIGKVYC